MTRVFQTGWEIGFGSNAATIFDARGPDGYILLGSPVIDATVKRNGNSSLKLPFNAAGVAIRLSLRSSYTETYHRYYFRKSGNPAANTLVFYPDNNIRVYVDTSGQMYLTGSDTVQKGNNSGPLANNVWHLVELRHYPSGGNTNAALRVNGIQLADATTFVGANISVGTIDFYGFNATADMWVDDYAVNDASTSENNSWIGEGKIVLLLPVSDSQVGSWTGGLGGTTNLFQAINKTPPNGTATEDNTTQIESADSSGDNSTDEYRANLTTYSTAGINVASNIRCGFLLVNHGEDVGTGTKTITYGLYSNPTQSNLVINADVTAGSSGALASYPSGWWWTGNVVAGSSFSSVTLGSSPVFSVRKTDTGTRVASIDFVGMYVEYVERSLPLRRRRFPMSVLNY